MPLQVPTEEGPCFNNVINRIGIETRNKFGLLRLEVGMFNPFYIHKYLNRYK